MTENKTRIVISAEDRASAVLKNIGAQVGTLGESLKTMPGLMGALASGVTVGAIVAHTKAIIDEADAMRDMAQKTGIGIAQLTGYKLAAEQSGTSIDSVAKGVRALSSYMVEHADKLTAAGITAKDADGAMRQLADLFSALPDGVDKAALATELFGARLGADLIPLLNLGSQGLAESAEKARAYGEALEKLAPNADEFNDQLAELALNSQAAGITIAQYFIPGMIGLAQFLNDLAKGGQAARQAIEWIAEHSGDVKLILAVYDGYQSVFGEKRSTPVSGKINYGNTARGLSLDEELALGAKNEAVIDAQRRAGGLLGGKPSAKPAPKAAARTPGVDLTDYVDPYDGFRDAMREKEALERLSDKYQDIADPMRKFRKQFAEIDRLKQEQPELSAQWAAAEAVVAANVMDLQDQLAGVNEQTEKQNDIARDLGMTFTSAFEDAIVGGKKFSEVLKGLEQDIARIIIRKSITEPLGNAIAGMVGNLFGGGRASGGPVNAGQFYVVGENGPEILVPNGAGTVIPNHQLGQGGAGGGVQISMPVTIDARGADSSVMPRLNEALASLEQRIYRTVPALVSRQQLRNRITPMSA